MHAVLAPSFTSADFWAIAPVTFLVFCGLAVLLLDAFFPRREHEWLAYLSIASLLLTGALASWLQGCASREALSGMLLTDPLSHFAVLTLLVAAALSCISSLGYLREMRADRAEYYGLLLLCTAGAMLMVQAGDLVMIFLGLETMSIALYVLVAMRPDNRLSTEASLKYFLLGAFTSALLLFGMALVYGGSGGQTNLGEILATLQSSSAGTSPVVLIAGAILVLLGFLFKVAVVPFHMWAPDVYLGAPTNVTAFMATGVKAAAFVVLLRLVGLSSAMTVFRGHLADVLWVLAALSMTVGNLVALQQTSVKRMLAYSSITHAGYMLVGVLTFLTSSGELATRGTGSVLFYLVAYVLMNLGAFGVVALLGREGEEGDNLQCFKGLSRNRPLVALAMAVLMFSLAGIPPSAGFMGKFYLFAAGLKAGYVWLVVLALLNSAISVFYYLRVVMLMYMQQPEGEYRKAETCQVCASCGLALTSLGVVLLGILPGGFLHYALESARSLLP
ncbi:MAG: hypothetical protein A2284_13710 [Deltaproteobacteria bacterium RIFOXYA12_FULL_61_11]|nr:MAG: hypothetical protein A2284_13710 [Deltaproteobacteria bacterium RIFOXYA12_FULL_61_11]